MTLDVESDTFTRVLGASRQVSMLFFENET